MKPAGTRAHSGTGTYLSEPEPAPYGHNRYRVYDIKGKLLGTVTGGGDRKAVGRSDWWYADPAGGGPSLRYNRNRTEAIERLKR